MNKIKPLTLLLFVIFMNSTSIVKAQKKEIFKSKLGVNVAVFNYSSNSSGLSPALQLSFDDLMVTSIGPLFKTDKNYQTIGLDITSKLRFGNCKNSTEPIMDWNLQYFKTKTASDSIQKNILFSVGFGFYTEMKLISISTTIGYGMNSLDLNNDLCFFKVSIGFPNLYRYKSIIQPQSKHKSKT